jgi:hypothetical protein
MVILFSRDSCEFLAISQLIFLILNSKCLLLAFICVSHVSFLSRCSPKYNKYKRGCNSAMSKVQATILLSQNSKHCTNTIGKGKERTQVRDTHQTCETRVQKMRERLRETERRNLRSTP